MILLGIGILGFGLLLLFDISSLANKNLLKYFFGITGFLSIFVSSILIVAKFSYIFEIDLAYRLISLVLGIIFLVLLIYSVFIEVGKKTYTIENEHSLVTDGTYALSRHPGVVWMLLLYIFGAIFFQNLLAIYAALIWTTVNIIYVSIQERYIFHKIFDNYDTYRESTPMIFPNYQSIEKFITTKNWRRT